MSRIAPTHVAATLRRRFALAALALAAAAAAAAPAAAAPTAMQCGEDGFEDNDTCAQAYAISSPFTASGLVTYKFDPDYFWVTVPPGQALQVDAFFSHSIADVDVYVYDRNGACGGILNYLSRSISSSDDESVNWQNTSSNPVEAAIKIEIFPGSIPTCNTYDLLVTVAPVANPCDPATSDDPLEDNDSCGTAVPLPLGTTNDLWVSRDDGDFYHITLEAGETLDARALFINSIADIDLFLYDANGPCGGGFGSGELASGFTQNNNEQVVWSNIGGSARTVILHVDVFDTDSCNNYDLQITVTGGGVGSNYCQPNANSTGQLGLIRASGSTSVAANNLRLTASQLPPMSFGFFLNGLTQGFTPNAGGSSGNLCLSGAVGRHDNDILNAGMNGSFALTVDLLNLPQPTGAITAAAGQTWNFQTWHRDSVGGSVTSNFTNGITVILQP